MGIFDFFKKKKKAPPIQVEQDPVLEETYAIRDKITSQFGKTDDLLLAPVIDPFDLGGPAWPNLRQAWRVYQKNGNTIIVSDGLSDPFEDEEGYEEQGFGMEIYAETSDVIAGEMQASWLFRLVERASRQVVSNGSFYQLLDELQVVSGELRLPEGLGFQYSEDGRVGVMFGVKNPHINSEFELPKGKAKLVSVKVLTRDELLTIREEGQEGRNKLAQKFNVNKTYHISTLQ